MDELEAQTIVRALALLSLVTPGPLPEHIAEKHFVAGKVLFARFRAAALRTALPGLHTPSCDPDPLRVSIDYMRATPSAGASGVGMVLPLPVMWNERTSLYIRWTDHMLPLGAVARMLPPGKTTGLRRAKFLVDPSDLPKDDVRPELFLLLDKVAGDVSSTLAYRLGWLDDARCDDYDGGYAVVGFVDPTTVPPIVACQSKSDVEAAVKKHLGWT